jgi:hypothetical protein
MKPMKFHGASFVVERSGRIYSDRINELRATASRFVPRMFDEVAEDILLVMPSRITCDPNKV